jgi:hypothetical protein
MKEENDFQRTKITNQQAPSLSEYCQIIYYPEMQEFRFWSRRFEPPSYMLSGVKNITIKADNFMICMFRLCLSAKFPYGPLVHLQEGDQKAIIILHPELMMVELFLSSYWKQSLLSLRMAYFSGYLNWEIGQLRQC